MSPLAVAFVWHMHQPYYTDPVSRTALLPWARLHSTRSYYDMASLLEEFPDVRVTFNLVPSLLRQIEQYSHKEIHDPFRDVAEIPAADLEIRHKIFLLHFYFYTNWDTMIDPYPRYRELLNQRGRHHPEKEVEGRIREFSVQDYRDLQVWFNLTWMGFGARKKIPELNDLFEKGAWFSEEDKRLVLEAQDNILAEVIPLYRKLAQQGQIELTTSPFYHPILPLLIDSGCARRALPNLPLPAPFRHMEDAEAQISKAVQYHQNLFGKPPRGFWPSEGSVSPELIPILADAGLQWTATDEEILIHSLGAGRYRAEALYQPYRINLQGKEMNIIFRDKTLSNLISFSYSRRSSRDAAADLRNHLQGIESRTGSAGRPALCAIILDGENPWEYYPGGGEEFLRLTYGSFSGNLRTTTVSAYLDQYPAQESLPQLYTGSWINHNFDIWIGDKEENTAWELLSRARQDLSARQPASGDGQFDEAWEAIYRAEGSDWFWWFGDDFDSEQKPEFDRIFRLHLQNAYRLSGAEVPAEFLTPVRQREAAAWERGQSGFISPDISGSLSHFYEWQGAVHFNPATASGTMVTGSLSVNEIHYGQDRENFCRRVDPHFPFDSKHNQGLTLKLRFLSPAGYSVSIPLDSSEPKSYTLYRQKSGEQKEAVGTPSLLHLGEIGEMAIPLEFLQVRIGETLRFVIQIRQGSALLETFPFQGVFSLLLQPENERIWWGV